MNESELSLNMNHSYWIQVREDEFNDIINSRCVMHQHTVDQYAKIERDRLKFFKTNPKQLKPEIYQDLLDAIAIGNNNDVGFKIILLTSHIGPPPGVTATVSRLEWFSVTAKPKWTEIREVQFASGNNEHILASALRTMCIC